MIRWHKRILCILLGLTLNCNCQIIILTRIITYFIYPWASTTKKSSYCIVFFSILLKTAVTEELVVVLYETAGIRNPITAFQHWCFINYCNMRPIAVVSKTASIGSPIVAFSNCRYRSKLSIFYNYFLNNNMFQKLK